MSSYIASPLSRKDIREKAELLRTLFVPADVAFCPIHRIVERDLYDVFDDYRLEVMNDSDLPGREAEFVIGTHTIRVRQSVLEKAATNDGRARYTLAHELGHLFLHHGNSISLCSGLQESVNTCSDPEWQAERFAADFLAPLKLIWEWAPEYIANVCGISLAAAKVRCSQTSELFWEGRPRKIRQMEFKW